MRRLPRGLVVIDIAFLVTFAAINADAAPQARTVFGPEIFIRQTAAPIVAERSFTVPSFISPPLVLDVWNGEPATGSNRVTAAWVTLDGREVLGPDQFKKTVGTHVGRLPRVRPQGRGRGAGGRQELDTSTTGHI